MAELGEEVFVDLNGKRLQAVYQGTTPNGAYVLDFNGEKKFITEKHCDEEDGVFYVASWLADKILEELGELAF